LFNPERYHPIVVSLSLEILHEAVCRSRVSPEIVRRASCMRPGEWDCR
jgi:hypothetical protein